MVEHLAFNQRVEGSSPSDLTIRFSCLQSKPRKPYAPPKLLRSEGGLWPFNLPRAGDSNRRSFSRSHSAAALLCPTAPQAKINRYRINHFYLA